VLCFLVLWLPLPLVVFWAKFWISSTDANLAFVLNIQVV
jgi:hypothetical protein